MVAGSTNLDFAAAFEKELADGTEPTFEPVQDALPVIMKDNEGNRWDIFGYAVEGPRKGERLTPALAYYGYWFAWGSFFYGVITVFRLFFYRTDYVRLYIDFTEPEVATVALKKFAHSVAEMN